MMVGCFLAGVTDVPTKVMFDFLCKAVGGELATSDETSACKWVLKEQVLDYITLPAIRGIVSSSVLRDGAFCNALGQYVLPVAV